MYIYIYIYFYNYLEFYDLTGLFTSVRKAMTPSRVFDVKGDVVPRRVYTSPCATSLHPRARTKAAGVHQASR